MVLGAFHRDSQEVLGFLSALKLWSWNGYEMRIVANDRQGAPECQPQQNGWNRVEHKDQASGGVMAQKQNISICKRVRKYHLHDCHLSTTRWLSRLSSTKARFHLE